MLVYLVQYLVFMINNFPRSTSLVEDMSPREKLTGKKLDYSLECKLEFGEYVQANEENTIKNSMQSRTFPAICLGPVGNIQGSYYFLNLNTWEVVKRRGWMKLPLPNDIIQKINAKSAREQMKTLDGQKVTVGDLDFENDDTEENDEENGEISPLPAETLDNYGNVPVDNDNQEPAIQVENNEEWDYNPQYFHDEDNALINDNNMEEGHDEESSHGYNLRDTPQRRADREKRALALLAYKVCKVFATYNTQKAIRDWGEEAEASMMKEMKQLHDKEVFEPVDYNSLTPKQKLGILRSLMHTKRKRNGLLKSRFLADGSKQDRLSSAVDPSSPTVSILKRYSSLQP